MSQDQIRQIQQLISAGRFAEARAILQSIDRPDIPQLLAQLDAMERAAAAAQPQPVTQTESTADYLNRLDDTGGEAAAAAGPATPAPEAPRHSRKGELTGTDAEGRRIYYEGTYEMLWDCQYCGTKKLLGKTHRFCPNCGAAQNPDSRYFPSEEEQIAVEDHVFVGADITCKSCGTLNSGNAEFCGNCGSPLTDSARARTQAEQVRGAGEHFASSGSRDIAKERFDAEMERVGVRPKAGKKGFPRWAIALIIGLVVLLCGGVLVSTLWTKEAGVVLTGHSWERTIFVEQYGPVNENEWCSSMPGGAYNVSRRQEIQSYRQVPDGEDCQMVRVDSGDGTFRTEQRCQTRYRDEPVYADKCYYTIDRWSDSRTARSSGSSQSDAPYWPELNLNCEGQTRAGCERERNREGRYVLILHNTDENKEYTCEVTQERWQSAPLESRWQLQVGGVMGDARCDTLEPAR